MNPKERGLLLLRSSLGDPDRKRLTAAQCRILGQRIQAMARPQEERELELQDLLNLGYDPISGQQILSLLRQEDWLEEYLRAGKRNGCVPVTRLNPQYPPLVLQRLGLDAPCCYWAKGDLAILDTPAVSLVGSRDLLPENHTFAERVGYEAAVQGFTLVSGNARGADRTAQDACLAAGGRVISILPDALTSHSPKRNQLLLSEEDFNTPFSNQRALSRNKSIHAMGLMVFVAQSGLRKGGTWDGTVKNLHFCWSTVACFQDGSESSQALFKLGAWPMDLDGLHCMEDLKNLL